MRMALHSRTLGKHDVSEADAPTKKKHAPMLVKRIYIYIYIYIYDYKKVGRKARDILYIYYIYIYTYIYIYMITRK
jgi:hypothetical protein